MAIFVKKGGEDVKLSARQIKQQTMKLRGWDEREYQRQYDLFKNRLRAYESFKGASLGEEPERQSPSELLYKEAKAMKAHGAEYEPSAKMKQIQSFPAVSITKGKRGAIETSSAYYQKRTAQYEAGVQKAFGQFIAKVGKASEIDETIENPVKKEKALSALADYIHKQQKATGDGGAFKSGEAFGSDPLGEDFDYSEWLD